MFQYSKKFNNNNSEGDIQWYMANDCKKMFEYSENFNMKLNSCDWSNVENMQSMFGNSYFYNGADQRSTEDEVNTANSFYTIGITLDAVYLGGEDTTNVINMFDNQSGIYKMKDVVSADGTTKAGSTPPRSWWS
jgi:hypothetical protein